MIDALVYDLCVSLSTPYLASTRTKKTRTPARSLTLEKKPVIVIYALTYKLLFVQIMACILLKF